MTTNPEPKILADVFADRMLEYWDSTQGAAKAIDLAKAAGATLYKVPGDCHIAEFMDGSFALLSNNGNAILTTWLEQDVEIPR